MIGNLEWEDDEETVIVDMRGIKGGGIVLCWVNVVVVGIVDEMGTVVMGGSTRGELIIWGIIGVVGDEAVVIGRITNWVGDETIEEGEDLGDWWIRYFCTT